VDDPFCQLFTINGMLKNNKGMLVKVIWLNHVNKGLFS
jgi:hypothetical protein